MASFNSQKMKALQEHWESRRCKHDGAQELRKRTVRLGGIQFVKQCLRCGAATTSPLATAKAIEANGGIEPPPFDDALEVKWRKDGQEGEKKITGDFDSREELRTAEFHNWYDVYLSSDEWADKKSKVMQRANNLCEGCGDARAQVVHHMSYKNVGEEFLFELVALCHPCHERYHKNDGSTEGYADTESFE
jgi:hypothetical protein